MHTPTRSVSNDPPQIGELGTESLPSLRSLLSLVCPWVSVGEAVVIGRSFRPARHRQVAHRPCKHSAHRPTQAGRHPIVRSDQLSMIINWLPNMRGSRSRSLDNSVIASLTGQEPSESRQ